MTQTRDHIVWSVLKLPLNLCADIQILFEEPSNYIGIFYHFSVLRWPVAYFIKEFNPSLTKPPLKFNGDLAEIGVTSSIK